MSGREEILEALGRGGAVNVFGLPGVGKTTALVSLEQSIDEAVGSARVDLSGVEDLEFKLLATLGPGAGTLPEALAGSPPGFVLMLDHVDAHAEELREAWPTWRSSAPEVRFVFASRSALMWPGVRDVRLMGLSDERARALLEEVAPGWLEGATSAVAEELLGLLDGNPLALGFAGRRARLLTPAQLLERLNERVDVLRAPRMELSVAAVLDEVWSALSEDARLVACRARAFASPQPIGAYERVLVDDRLDEVALLDALDELDAYGALRVESGRMRPSRLLVAHGATRAPEDDEDALSRRHVAWVSGRCAGWLERTSARPRELLVEVAPELEEITRAWDHTRRGVGPGSEHEALARVVTALVTHRTSTMTQVSVGGEVDLTGVPPEVVLERADRMWRSGQTRGAHAALAGATGTPGLDMQLTARLYGALARVQRELGLWRDAARSFGLVSGHAERAGDHARQRRYAWRQCEALLEAGDRPSAARVLARLLSDDATASAPSEARVALALAGALVGTDPGAARAALDACAVGFAGAEAHEAEMRRGDADYVEGAHASALARYEALPRSLEVTRRLVELWCVTGDLERAAARAEDALRAGVARWIGGDALGAVSRWSEAAPTGEVESERIELLIKAASGEPLGRDAARAEPTRRVLAAWSRDEELDTAGEVWPGEGGAGWLARVLALHPRTRRAPVTAAMLAQAQREDAWIVLANGEGFVSPSAGFVSLREKQTLARVLASLARQHVSAPGEPVGFDEAYAFGWPDQLHTPTDSARNRLRVAIRRLRDAGLRPVLLTKPSGYLLSIDADVTIHEM